MSKTSIGRLLSGVVEQIVEKSDGDSISYGKSVMFPSGTKMALLVQSPSGLKQSEKLQELEYLTKQIGLSQKEAAFALGMSQSRASQLLNHK